MRKASAWYVRQFRQAAEDSYTLEEVCGLVGVILLGVAAIVACAGFGG